MISPREIKQRALKLWENGSFLRSWLTGEQMFPYAIPFGKPASGKLIGSFPEIRDKIAALKTESKQAKGYGYTVCYTPVLHRQLGRQEMPEKILFETEEDFLKLTGKEKDFSRFKSLAHEALERIPELKPFLVRKPDSILENRENWLKLIAVLEYFIHNPEPGVYIRQLSIPGIDTKFIEGHKAILRDLLDTILVRTTDSTGPSFHAFERRFGLRYDEPLIRFRLLDRELIHNGMSDISLPLSEFNRIEFPGRRVFITENKINGLSFPSMESSMVVFGLGYGIQALKNTPWLKDKMIYYWGDIDTHGYGILSSLRGFFPDSLSLMMDGTTLMAFSDFWSVEDPKKRCLHDLAGLTVGEILIYDELRHDRHGACVRLEQERIAYSYICRQLEKLPPLNFQRHRAIAEAPPE